MARKAGQLISRGSRTWLVRISLGRDSETGTRKYHNKTIRGSNVAYVYQPDNASGTRLTRTSTINQDIAVDCGQPMTGLGPGPHHS